MPKQRNSGRFRLCLYCHKRYWCWASHLNRTASCSRECKQQHQRKSKLYRWGRWLVVYAQQCLHCGQTFQNIKNYERQFCSQRCSGLAHAKYPAWLIGVKPWNKGIKTGIKPWLGKHRPEVGMKLRGRQRTLEQKQRIKTATQQFIHKFPAQRKLACQKGGFSHGTGPGHPAYINGQGNFPYPNGFNTKLKQQIKQRDSLRCQNCKATEHLVVHHIDYNKHNLDFLNLITLCNVCNVKANYGREKWKQIYSTRVGNLVQS